MPTNEKAQGDIVFFKKVFEGGWLFWSLVGSQGVLVKFPLCSPHVPNVFSKTFQVTPHLFLSPPFFMKQTSSML
jgi:hypothetical protein